MTIAHVTEELSAFMDGELGEAERSRVAEHLAGCPECQQQLEELRQLEALAQALPRELAPPSDLAKRVRTRLERKRAPAPQWWWAAAAAVVLAFVPWMIFRQQSPAGMSTPVAREEAMARKADTPTSDGFAGAPAESKVQPEAPAVQSNGKKRLAEALPPADKEARLKDGERDERGRLDEPSKNVAQPWGADAAPKSISGAQDSVDIQTAPQELPPPAAAAAPEPGRRAQNAPKGVAKGEAGAGASSNEGYGSTVASQDDVDSYRWLRTARIQNGDNARHVRDEWLRVFARAGGRPHGEPALAAAIEAAAAAFHYDRRPDDLLRLRNLAATYLTRPNPTSAAHVRELLAKAEAEKAP